MEKRYLSIEELAQYISVSPNTIRSWVWQRKIPCFKAGRLVRFDKVEIDNWLKDNRVKQLA